MNWFKQHADLMYGIILIVSVLFVIFFHQYFLTVLFVLFAWWGGAIWVTKLKNRELSSFWWVLYFPPLVFLLKNYSVPNNANQNSAVKHQKDED